MTDIRFMGKLPPSICALSLSTNPTRFFDHSYVVGHDIDIPQMELYSRVSKNLQKWIEKSKEDYKEAEEEVLKATPELFEEL
jgi:kinetochore protein Spc7/SPC105